MLLNTAARASETLYAQSDEFAPAIREIVELVHSPGVFWSEAPGLARRVMTA